MNSLHRKKIPEKPYYPYTFYKKYDLVYEFLIGI